VHVGRHGPTPVSTPSLIPDPAGAAPLTFPYLPMPLPSEDPRTARGIFIPDYERVSEHRFRAEPVVLIRSDGTTSVQPQLVCNRGDFLFSWAGNLLHGLPHSCSICAGRRG
jgi:hypothetical protein